MDTESRGMNGRALVVIAIAFSVLTMSWAIGGRSGCAANPTCAAQASDLHSAHRAKSEIIGASIHIVDPNAPHELATVPATTSND